LPDGEVDNVSTHFQFTGTNLPLIDIYISNMLRYRVIISYNIKFTCISGASSCFIEKAYIDGNDVTTAQNWPNKTNEFIIF